MFILIEKTIDVLIPLADFICDIELEFMSFEHLHLFVGHLLNSDVMGIITPTFIFL